MADTEEKQKMLAYNMKVIHAIWKYQKHGFGEMKIKGHEYDINSFYGTFEKSRQTIREIINSEYNYSEKKVKRWADKIEGKTGIPHKFLTGEDRIILTKEYEINIYPHYQDFLDSCDYINTQMDRAKEKPCGYSMARIKKLIKDKGNKEQYEKFQEITSTAESAFVTMQRFEDALNKEVAKLIKIDGYSDFDDVGTYKLFYFIKYGKPFDAVSIVTIDNIIDVFKKTRTRELKNLGQQGLEIYIKELQEQLKLAEAVYTVAVDCGDFKEK